MSISILGISAFYHDSAATLVVDGKIVAAAQEERFSRRKHDHAFPFHAIDFCLARAGLRPEQLDYVGFYDKPLMKFERNQFTSPLSRGLRICLRISWNITRNSSRARWEPRQKCSPIPKAR